ncbi:hypothetical protein [Pseudonocardia lacus]|uniref:hypothetical protein n=1 Tax=Pseudonocardia lacus TaxID=2835865 RepID=UPI001BDC7DC3|nr:hypothetical protein [Pseudonocardia lacus]
MGTVFAMLGIFLVALSPLVLGTIVLRVVRWVAGRGGRHRRGRPPLPQRGAAEESRSRNHP